MFVHRLEAQFHAGADGSAKMAVVACEDVVGDACPDVDDEAVLVRFLVECCCHEGEAVGSDFRFILIIE